MKEFYVNTAAQHKQEAVTSFFLVGSVESRTKKSGEGYLAMVLCDKTGQMEAKVWEQTESAKAIEAGQLVKVQGRISEYRGKCEIAIEKIRTAEDEEIEIADFLPCTLKDIDEMWAELNSFVDQVCDSDTRQLLQALLMDSNMEKQLKRAPAAKAMHHAYIGGLLEHVVSLCRLCILVHHNYPWVDRDLLVAGAVLHDIGKIHEFSYDRSIAYTDYGQLIGHIAIGLKLVQDTASLIPFFPQARLTILQHLILSHHGELQYGSPVEPAIPEAILLHLLDNTDAKMDALRTVVEAISDEQVWTEKVRALGRSVMKTENYL